MYSITKEQILEFVEWGNNADAKKVREEWFPGLFETKLSSKFTGWAKCEEKINIDWLMYFENGLQKYGFDASKQWAEMNSKVYLNGDEIEATEQEVKTALENEAVKRGFSKGVFVNPLEDKLSINSFEKENKNKVGSYICFDNGNMYATGFGKYCIFKNGIWAEIIPTLTKKEAEEKLGVKII